MSRKNPKGDNSTSLEEQLIKEGEMERIEIATKRAVRSRGASKPCGVFARSDWYWMWSKGVDLLDAVTMDDQPEEDGQSNGTASSIPPDVFLKHARERLDNEVSEICDAVNWNIGEYRKTFHITVAELAKAIDVSESTLRKKLNDGTLTLKEFLTLCAVCLTDPCVILGYVDSEDINLVRNIHYLDKASDHRAVGEFVQVLSHKQNGRTMIRRSVSPAIEADLGWDRAVDGNEDESTLPEWPLWWQTSFDYTVFNELVDEYLRSVKHVVPMKATYETRATAASRLIDVLRDCPELRSKYDQVLKTRSAIFSLQVNDLEEQAEALKSVEFEIYGEFLNMLHSKAVDGAEGDKE
ncbi:MAG: hypothetical protein K5859_06450 [Atopobiaceae bacterium]|nr:hypothetical protein [Atopobiaceae bacterium]